MSLSIRKWIQLSSLSIVSVSVACVNSSPNFQFLFNEHSENDGLSHYVQRRPALCLAWLPTPHPTCRRWVVGCSLNGAGIPGSGYSEGTGGTVLQRATLTEAREAPWHFFQPACWEYFVGSGVTGPKVWTVSCSGWKRIALPGLLRARRCGCPVVWASFPFSSHALWALPTRIHRHKDTGNRPEIQPVAWKEIELSSPKFWPYLLCR